MKSIEAIKSRCEEGIIVPQPFYSSFDGVPTLLNNLILAETESAIGDGIIMGDHQADPLKASMLYLSRKLKKETDRYFQSTEESKEPIQIFPFPASMLGAIRNEYDEENRTAVHAVIKMVRQVKETGLYNGDVNNTNQDRNEYADEELILLKGIPFSIAYLYTDKFFDPTSYDWWNMRDIMEPLYRGTERHLSRYLDPDYVASVYKFYKPVNKVK